MACEKARSRPSTNGRRRINRDRDALQHRDAVPHRRRRSPMARTIYAIRYSTDGSAAQPLLVARRRSPAGRLGAVRRRRRPQLDRSRRPTSSWSRRRTARSTWSPFIPGPPYVGKDENAQRPRRMLGGGPGSHGFAAAAQCRCEPVDPKPEASYPSPGESILHPCGRARTARARRSPSPSTVCAQPPAPRRPAALLLFADRRHRRMRCGRGTRPRPISHRRASRAPGSDRPRHSKAGSGRDRVATRRRVRSAIGNTPAADRHAQDLHRRRPSACGRHGPSDAPSG